MLQKEKLFISNIALRNDLDINLDSLSGVPRLFVRLELTFFLC